MAAKKEAPKEEEEEAPAPKKAAGFFGTGRVRRAIKGDGGATGAVLLGQACFTCVWALGGQGGDGNS